MQFNIDDNGVSKTQDVYANLIHRSTPVIYNALRATVGHTREERGSTTSHTFVTEVNEALLVSMFGFSKTHASVSANVNFLIVTATGEYVAGTKTVMSKLDNVRLFSGEHRELFNNLINVYEIINRYDVNAYVKNLERCNRLTGFNLAPVISDESIKADVYRAFGHRERVSPKDTIFDHAFFVVGDQLTTSSELLLITKASNLIHGVTFDQVRSKLKIIYADDDFVLVDQNGFERLFVNLDGVWCWLNKNHLDDKLADLKLKFDKRYRTLTTLTGD